MWVHQIWGNQVQVRMGQVVVPPSGAGCWLPFWAESVGCVFSVMRSQLRNVMSEVAWVLPFFSRPIGWIDTVCVYCLGIHSHSYPYAKIPFFPLISQWQAT